MFFLWPVCKIEGFRCSICDVKGTSMTSNWNAEKSAKSGEEHVKKKRRKKKKKKKKRKKSVTGGAGSLNIYIYKNRS